MARVFVSIGSNIERANNIRAAVRSLRTQFGPVTLSDVYENRPIGFEGDNFYNLVATFVTHEAPTVVNAILHDIENRQGRRRGSSRFSPRTIDLDLLLYNDMVCNTPDLRLPRDEINEYACVLRPLAELAPAAVHPITGKTFNEQWSNFDQSAQALTRIHLEFPD